jgi:hypothetical protein
VAAFDSDNADVQKQVKSICLGGRVCIYFTSQGRNVYSHSKRCGVSIVVCLGKFSNNGMFCCFSLSPCIFIYYKQVIPDLDIVNQIGNTSKQIISMCDNVEAAAGPARSIVALSSTRSRHICSYISPLLFFSFIRCLHVRVAANMYYRMELVAACRATAAATTRLIYTHTGEYLYRQNLGGQGKKGSV